MFLVTTASFAILFVVGASVLVIKGLLDFELVF
jgi:hypothetical protein